MRKQTEKKRTIDQLHSHLTITTKTGGIFLNFRISHGHCIIRSCVIRIYRHPITFGVNIEFFQNISISKAKNVDLPEGANVPTMQTGGDKLKKTDFPIHHFLTQPYGEKKELKLFSAKGRNNFCMKA